MATKFFRFNRTSTRTRYLVLIFITAIFSAFSHHAVAETTVTNIQSIPLSTLNRICSGLLLSKQASCKTNDQIHYIRSYPITNEKVLLFFFLKNTQTRYHRGLTIPVTVDSKGQWVTGKSFVGEPHQVVSDKAQGKSGLWMHAQYNDSGKKPLLLYSQNGLDWAEVDLPEDKNYLLEEIDKLCFRGRDLYLTMHSADSILVAWKADSTQLLLTTPTQSNLWQKADVKTINSSSCVANKVKNSQWLVQDGETLSLLVFDAKGNTKDSTSKDHTKNITIKIPKVTQVTKSKSISRTMVTKDTATKPSQKGYAIQVGVFKDYSYVKGVVTEMQQAGFNTFTKELNVKGTKVKKIYVGPFKSRSIATKQLQKLRTNFNNDKGIQFSFIVAM